MGTLGHSHWQLVQQSVVIIYSITIQSHKLFFCFLISSKCLLFLIVLSRMCITDNEFSRIMSICSQLSLSLSLSRARSCDLAYGPIVIAYDHAILVKPNSDHNFGQILTFWGLLYSPLLQMRAKFGVL